MSTLSLLRNVFFVIDLDTEMNESEHGEVHQDALDQQRSLKMIPKPENDSERVCHEQGQTHKHGESLGGLFGLYL